MIRIVDAREIQAARPEPVTAATLAEVAPIVEDVRHRGMNAVRTYAERFGEIREEEAIVLGREAIAARAASVSKADLDLLARVAGRISAFASAQRAAMGALDVEVMGGRAGHALVPVAKAGCYAPGGRYPLPSSVLMTACVARAAGVERVVVASPRPAPITCAAAMVAGADAMLTVGGAHAIAAMAYGVEGLPPVDVIVGPGNRYVTAAKKLVFGAVGIDMLAGPSELAVLEHESGTDAAGVASDLLAQAEHDDDAKPVLITTSRDLAGRVAAEVEAQLASLPTAATARRACENGMIAVAATLDDAIRAVNDLAPEHLEILASDPSAVAARCVHAGAVFLGRGSAEVFGDYGVGPNHTLPTGGSARYSAGLSVATFLRVRTWLRIAPTAELVSDTARLARLEGLEGHARAAETRSAGPSIIPG